MSVTGFLGGSRRRAFRVAALVGSLALVAGLGAACSKSGSGTVTLTYAAYVPKDNPHSIAHKWWMDEVEKRTDGAVKFEAIYGGALCDSGNVMVCVSDGRADMGTFTPLRHPAEFPLTNMMSLPFRTSGLQADLLALNELYQNHKGFKAEFDAAKQNLLYFGPVPAPLLGLNKPITDIGDLKGKKFRIPGLMSVAFGLLGVSSVTMIEPEIYESMQRGVIDGAITAPDGHTSFRTYEVAKQYVDVGAVSGPLAAMTTTINAKRFDSLPKNVQDVIMEVSAELQKKITSDFFAPEFEKQCKTMKAAAPIISMKPAAEAEKWAAEAKKATEQAWIASLSGDAAANAQALLSDYRTALGKYERELTDDATFSSRCEADK